MTKEQVTNIVYRNLLIRVRRRNVTREQNQALILKCAHKLFRKYGYSKTTVLDIAKDLGLSTGHIYKFFSSKNAIIEAYAGMRFDEIKMKVSRDIHSKRSAVERIADFAEAHYWFHRDLFRNERQTYATITLAFEGRWKCSSDFLEFNYKQIGDFIEQGIRAKEFKLTDASAHARILGDCLTWVMHPFLFQEIKPSEVRPRLQAQIKFFLKALK